MKDEEQIFAALEEINSSLKELKKKTAPATDMSPIMQKIDALENSMKDIKITVPMGSLKDTIIQICDAIEEIKQIRREESPQVKHVYINVKEPLWWIMGAVSVILISIIICVHFYDKNQGLKEELESLKPNDIKYRFFKLSNLPLQELLKKDFKTSAECVAQIDNQYKKDANKIINFVLNREEELRKAVEAEELSRLKEAEAKEAAEEAKKLKKKADSLVKK